VTLGGKFYSLLCKQEVVTARNYFQIFFLIAFFEEVLTGNIIITLGIKYKIIIIVRINDNYAVINNKYGRLRNLIFLFKIFMLCAKIASKFRDNLGARAQKSLQSPSCDKIIAVCSMNIRKLKRSVSRKQYI
jgi:hypothetical protein